MEGIQYYLLLVACSQRKRPDQDLMPALERYDGNTYRVIRKLQRENQWPSNVDVLILSAEFGLIAADQPIPLYERRMDRARATELRPAVLEVLRNHLRNHIRYVSMYVDLGQDYLPAIEGVQALCCGTPIVYAQGRIGQRLANLKHWLVERWKQP
jgi:hypothetical protein